MPSGVLKFGRVGRAPKNNMGRKTAALRVYQVVERNSEFDLCSLALDYRGDKDDERLVGKFSSEAEAERWAEFFRLAMR